MESLVIEGKNYISSKRAAELMGYTQDYIGQLARSGKISAERVSGVWYVSEDEFSGLSNNPKKKENFVDDLSNPDRGGITNKNNTQNNLNDTLTEQSKVVKDKSSIVLDGVDYISSKRAAQIMGYTQDYIGQLCRGGKIEARQVGRGWYVPKSVVYKDAKKVAGKTQISQKEAQVEAKKEKRKEVLGDIVVFKKENKNEKPIKLGGLLQKERQVEKQPQKEVVVEEVKIAQKSKPEEKPVKKIAEDEYYYPSFLNATYSLDDTPLVPTPKRPRELMLHQIVTDVDKGTYENNVAIRRTQPRLAYTAQKITRDILKPQKQELVKRTPMSLMKMASLGVAMMLFASAVTFTPSISVFSSNTGTLKTVFLLKTPQHDTLKAEVVTATSKISLIETIFNALGGIFENKIEYKAK